MNPEEFSKEDYLMQEPLHRGQIDVSCHWFHHVPFGVRHNFPLKAVVLMNDAPGMKILVANRIKDSIRSAADFKGRNIAEGAGYATKSVLVNYLARQAGLPRGSYNAVSKEVEGRQENVIKGLKDGSVDVLAFMEPMTSAILATGLVSPLYDLTTKTGTVRALGEAWPAQSVFVSDRFIAEKPETVQHVVNAFVRTLRFVNSHTAEEIVAKLPAAYFEKRDRAAETERIRKALPTFAQGDYSFGASAVKLALDTIETSAFDDSDEGKFRATTENKNVRAEDLYTNRFVAAAMRQFAANATTPTDSGKSLLAQAERAKVVAERGRAPHYQNKFDLSGVPAYVPRAQLTGWIRLHGNNYLADGALGDFWQQGFAKFQPGIRLSFYLPTSAVAFAALYYDQADLVMGHKLGFYDLLAYERMKSFQPVEITAVTGSYDVAGWENSIVILVKEACPLTSITLEQLDGVFGAAREGGWAGTNFRPDLARGPEKNIRTWGQLGVKGEWANQPINVYGFNLRYNTATDFADKVLGASDKWNENIHAYGHIVQPDGTRYIQADQITDNLAKDRFGIAFNRYRGERPKVKRLAIAPKGGGAPVAHTIENIQSRRYPLFNEAYFYTSVKPGVKMDPLVKEFLRYILSREGQEAVPRDGKYLPLTAGVVREQIKKLE